MAHLNPPHLITRANQLAALIDRLQTQPAIAVDTESDSLFVYREKVCLIQISIPGDDFLIDPLAYLDISPLRSIFAAPQIKKIFHASEYDVMCLRRDYSFTFANLYDTMWTARILGWPRVGLGDILNEKFDVTLDKKWQRHNWGKRPIEPGALTYARFDTHYLLQLYEVQSEELRQRDRLTEAEEVFGDLAQSIYRGHDFSPDDLWHVKGVYDLSARAQAILKQLLILRDREARRQDRPAFKVFGDKTLLALADLAPRNVEQMQHIEGMSPGQLQRYGNALLAAIAHGQHDATPTPPRRTSIDPDVIDRYERLRAWRKQVAAQRGVEPDVIVSNAILMDLAQRHPRTVEALPTQEWFGPWRRQTYGAAIVEVLKKG
ncbi:MAG: HRDC domain-containing protein [Thermoflexales bacterium]|nr:HRDC domain-containing protein [Thermoflexales bacterium]